MGIFGKLLGGIFGFFIGGPLGAAIGILLGHQIDKGATQLEEDVDWSRQDRASIQRVFFDTTFAVMGHLAKADGRVSEAEIQRARAIMQRLGLSEAQRTAAIARFNAGKDGDFDLRDTLQNLRRVAPGRHDLLQLFLEIQIELLLSDGAVDAHEYQLLDRIATQLGFNEIALQHLIALVQGEGVFHQRQQHQRSQSATPAPDKLGAAYAVLGVSSGIGNSELKTAYRRLMAQHHPDKLIAQGLPQEMVTAATRRVQEIQEAYECIKKSRA